MREAWCNQAGENPHFIRIIDNQFRASRSVMGPGMLWQSERSESQRTVEDEAKTQRAVQHQQESKGGQISKEGNSRAEKKKKKIGHSLITNPNRMTLSKSDHPYFKGKSQFASN